MQAIQDWSRRFGTVVILVVLLIVVGVAVIWSYGGTWLAEKSTELLNAHVLAEESQLAVADFTGFPLRNVGFTSLRLEQGGPDTTYSFMAARDLEINYDLWGIINGRYVASRVDVEGLRMEFRTFGDGPIRLPEFRGSDEGGDGGVPDFWVKSVHVHDGEILFEFPWRLFTADSVEAELEIRARGDDVRFEFKHVTGRVADTGELLEITGGAFVVDPAFRFDEVVGTWGGSPFRVSGTPGDLDITLAVSDLPLARLGQFLELEDTLDPGHVEHIEGRITEDPDGVSFTWEGAGGWLPYSAHGLSGKGRIEDRVLTLSEVGIDADSARASNATIIIPFDEPTVTVEGDFQNLHTFSLQVEVLQDWPGVLDGSGRVKIWNRGQPLRKVDARLDLGRGHLLEVPFVDGFIAGEIIDENWHVDSVQVNLEQAGMRGRGILGVDEIDLAFGYQGDLRPWRRFLRRDELEGEGHLRVRLQGPKERPVLQASGGLFRVEIANITAPQIELREANGVVVGGRRLAIGFAAPRGIEIAGTPFSQAEGNLVVTENQMVMDDLRIDSGDTTITVAGTLEWDPMIRIQVDRAEASVEGRRFWVDEPCQITFADDVLTTGGVHVHMHEGAFELAGSWNTRTHFIHALGKLEGPDLAGFFPPGRLPDLIVGEINGTFDVVGVFPNLNGNVDLDLDVIKWPMGAEVNGRRYEAIIDSARVVLSVEGSTVTAERVQAHVHQGNLLASGDMDWGGPVVEEVMKLIDGTAIDPDSLLMDVHLRAFNASLPHWRFLLPDRERAVGLVSGDLRIQGAANRPRMHLNGTTQAFIWGEFEADTVSVKGTYADGSVTLDPLLLRQEGKASFARGTFPLDLALHPFAWELPEREMDLQVDAEDGSLKNVELTPWISGASGSLEADVRVGGTPRAPRFFGKATVRDGQVQIENRDEVVVDVFADFLFESDLITVENARGMVGVSWFDARERGGLATATGTYRIGAREEETYELRIHGERVLVGELGVYAARATGDLVIKPERAWDGKIYPFARGKVFAHQVEYRGTLEPQDIGQLEPKSILYSIEIDAPAKVYIMTEGVDAELGGEEITVHQDVDKQSIFGRMEIFRCSYQFFQRNFKTTRGELIWEKADSRLPEMDIYAETFVAPLQIGVDLSGPVDEPVVEFFAFLDGVDIGLTQDEILRHLAVGSMGLSATTLDNIGDSGTGGPETSEQVAVATSQFFLGPLERELARQIGFVDEVDLETEGALGEFVPTVGVRKWVTPELSVQYRQGLSGTYQQALGVEYRLRRALYLRGSMSNDYLRSRGSNQEYNLDLKFRLSY